MCDDPENMPIGKKARALLAAFKKKQETQQKEAEDNARPQCKRYALSHLADMVQQIENAAKNGNHYVMYNKLTEPNLTNNYSGWGELYLKVIVEELKLLLEDCDVELDKSNRLRISWKD